jgi:hypothetical protein
MDNDIMPGAAMFFAGLQMFLEGRTDGKKKRKRRRGKNKTGNARKADQKRRKKMEELMERVAAAITPEDAAGAALELQSMAAAPAIKGAQIQLDGADDL